MSGLSNDERDRKLVDIRIARIARRQHGLFDRAQAMQCDATEETIAWRLKVGRWERLHPRVYRLAGTKETWRQDAMGACLYLGSGAALSHRAAAALGGLLHLKPASMEVTMKRGRNRSASPKLRVHLLTEPIPEEDITTIDGIPVTKPARTLLDLASTEPEPLVARCLDEMLRRRLVSLPFLETWLADPRRRRHRGAAVLRRMIGARATVGTTESPLASQILTSLRDARLPIPFLQYNVRDADRFVARLDFAYPDQRVGIEADGFRYHDRRENFDNERARGNALTALGWRVLRITAPHLERDPQSVITWVRRALLLDV